MPLTDQKPICMCSSDQQAKRLRIGMPADGSRFLSAMVLGSGREVRLGFDAAGYELTLPDDVSFDELNTTISLKRHPTRSS